MASKVGENILRRGKNLERRKASAMCVDDVGAQDRKCRDVIVIPFRCLYILDLKVTCIDCD